MLRNRKCNTHNASPNAVSAAAAVLIHKVLNCPVKSSKQTELVKKSKFVANNLTSIHLNLIIKLRRFKKVPNAALVNYKKAITKNKFNCIKLIDHRSKSRLLN